WLTHRIAYGNPENVKPRHYKKIRYSSTEERDQKINDFVFTKIDRAFRARRGVCIDYSLMLNALLEQFDLPTKVISGLAKTEVKDIGGEDLFKKHSWNAVRIAGEWKLMDATWAAGYVDEGSRKFVRSYLEHYFFTPPSDFILNHYPLNEEWQLLDRPVAMATFLGTPIFMPDYFKKGVVLSPKTKGTLVTKALGDNYLYFDALPDERLMHYKLNDSEEFKRMGFRRLNEKAFKSKIRVKSNLKKEFNYLTVYLDYQPILNFKIEK
ncbi:MAG: hypothetical protein KJN76_14485, partial [Eudoraea sp.]|nr:hypothetical protein [Eudoraea sp.]